MSLVKSKTIGMIFGQTICKGEIMKTVKYIVYPKLGNKTTKFEFDNAMDAVKLKKDNIYKPLIMSKRKRTNGKICSMSCWLELIKERLHMSNFCCV